MSGMGSGPPLVARNRLKRLHYNIKQPEMPVLERLGRETTLEIERLVKVQAQIVEIDRIERLRPKIIGPKIIGNEGHIAEADGKYSKSKARSA